MVLQIAVNDMANFHNEGGSISVLRLTFGSFRVFGVLKVAKTEVRGLVVVKALDDELPTNLAGKEEPHWALDLLEASERRETRREAIF